jgi:predicted ATP-grasp superfamily ATP-dependent carboligase
MKLKSVLVAGFNTRPLVYSLFNASYDIYAVDFFGDLDLYPYIKESLIVSNILDSDYNSMKLSYSEYLPGLITKLLKNNPNINYLIIGSGLDDAYKERNKINEEIIIRYPNLVNCNNDIKTLKQARNINLLFDYVKNLNCKVPLTREFISVEIEEIKYPIILKKKTGSGGINVFKIDNKDELNFRLKLLENTSSDPSDWLLQEYIDGIPISCTLISNGFDSEVISINRQIIGEKFLNSPQEFMYCGNTVPANLLKDDETYIKKISISLANSLKLKGINGIDFVLKSHIPYLMEINPRIPGSIRVSEEALNINLLDLHIKSFNLENWNYIKKMLKKSKRKDFATKLIYFAPNSINKEEIAKINNLEYVHDKSKPTTNISKGEPVCTVLYKGPNFSDSYFGSLKIIDKIKEIIE